MTTRATNSALQGRLSRQTNLANSRDPGDRRRDLIELLSPAVGLTFNLSRFGIGANGRGTYVFTGTLTDVNDGVSERIFFQIDGGSDDDRFYTRNPAATTGHTLVRFLAAAAGTANMGTLVDATQFRCAVAIDGAGNARGSQDGGVVVNISGGPTSGLTTLRLGQNVAGGSVLLGSIASVRIMPNFVAPDVELIQLST